MALYLIGDLQGCNASFARLLEAIDFSASRDTLFLLGDLVNRGPDSLGTLRRLVALGDAVQCLLGNHDLHALACWQGVRAAGRKDTLQDLLAAPDAQALLDWLRHRPMALQVQGWLLVHAGVLPQWSAAQTVALAREVQAALRAPRVQDVKAFLSTMYGNQPAQWHDALQGPDRLRVVVNALTRLRYCSAQGEMEFATTAAPAPGAAPSGFMPWFKVPGRVSQGQPIAFGHWSALGSASAGNAGVGSGEAVLDTFRRQHVLPLDSGCVWGGRLSAAKLGDGLGFELISVPCKAAQRIYRPNRLKPD